MIGYMANTHIVGLRVGRLTGVSLVERRSGDGHLIGLWLCACGNEKEIVVSRVINGTTISCGCLLRDFNSAKTTHGMRKSKTYSSWRSARQRTLNPKSKDYWRYGGLGVGFSERWYRFETFLEDMGERPEGTSLDRHPNSSGNYEPGNCRWATPTEQARNRKDIVVVKTKDGDIQLVDYAKKLGISKGAAHLRLKRGTLEGVIYE